ncbi:helix-turn-helix transcriptional regulator [Hellea balneolensis]|uniref:helix-turn-helix transcriptional regulator n=1 Tax=Hellea balneolensis TaxID=287478 RepID=UPI0004794BC6
MTDQLLTSKDVQAITGIKSRATLWKKSRNLEDRFPLPYQDGTRFTRWKLSEIQKWIDELELADS